MYSKSEMNSMVVEVYNELSSKYIKNKNEFLSYLNNTDNYNFYKESFKLYLQIFNNILTDDSYRKLFLVNIQSNDIFMITEEDFIKETKNMKKELIIKNYKIIRKYHKLYDLVIS